MNILNQEYRQNRSGFTIIELMAVLLIMGLVISLGIPVFQRVLADYQLQQTAENLAWEMRLQQQEAMASGVYRQIDFLRYGNYYLIKKPAGQSSVSFPEGVTYAYITLPKDSDNRYLLTFYPSGIPNLGGTIALKNSFDRHKYVVINPVIGRVRVSDVLPD